MSARLALLALALYPLAWRRRYGAEMEALIEDCGASPRTVADLLRGAVRAHLRPEPALTVDRDDRVRLGLSAVLLCWVLFALVGLALAKTTEGPPFEGKAGAPVLLGVARIGIEVFAVVGSLAVVLGAAPLVLAALRQAGVRPEVRRAALLAGAGVAAFVGATAALALVSGLAPHRSGGVDALVLAAWTLIVLGSGLACALAARRGLFAIAVPHRALAFAAACARVVALAMVAITVLTLGYLFELVAGASALASTPNGPLGNPDVRLSLLIQLAAMVVASIPAALAASRAWRAAEPSAG